MTRATHTKLLTTAAIFLLAVAAGCGYRALAPTPVGAGASASLSPLGATASSSTTLYKLTFTGDIQSGPLGPIALNPNNPWRGVSIGNATLTLPVSTDLAGCGLDRTNWGGDAGIWMGGLVIQQRGDFTHLGFQVSVNGSVTLNLAVNDPSATSSASGVQFFLKFFNAKAYLGASSPDPAADPCVTFTVTATPQ